MTSHTRTLLLSGLGGIALVALIVGLIYTQDRSQPYHDPNTPQAQYQPLPPLTFAPLTPSIDLVNISALPTPEAFGAIHLDKTIEFSSYGVSSFSKGLFWGSTTSEGKPIRYLLRDEVPTLPREVTVYQSLPDAQILREELPDLPLLPVRLDHFSKTTPKTFSFEATLGDLPYHFSIEPLQIHITQDYSVANALACPDNTCMRRGDLTEEQLLSDEVMIATAQNFLGIIGMSTEGLGTPFVDHSWRTSGQTAKYTYVPDRLTVIFPAPLTYASPTEGIRVTISQYTHSVEEVITNLYHLNSSSYPTASVEETITRMQPIEPTNDIIEVPLHSPKIELRQIEHTGVHTYLPFVVWQVDREHIKGGYFYQDEIAIPTIDNWK